MGEVGIEDMKDHFVKESSKKRTHSVVYKNKFEIVHTIILDKTNVLKKTTIKEINRKFLLDTERLDNVYGLLFCCVFSKMVLSGVPTSTKG